MTDRGSVCGRYIPIISGPTTSSRIAPTTGGSTACSTSSMSSPANAWQSGPAASSKCLADRQLPLEEYLNVAELEFFMLLTVIARFPLLSECSSERAAVDSDWPNVAPGRRLIWLLLRC